MEADQGTPHSWQISGQGRRRHGLRPEHEAKQTFPLSTPCISVIKSFKLALVNCILIAAGQLCKAAPRLLSAASWLCMCVYFSSGPDVQPRGCTAVQRFGLIKLHQNKSSPIQESPRTKGITSCGICSGVLLGKFVHWKGKRPMRECILAMTCRCYQ